jgi:hypothetical protein
MDSSMIPYIGGISPPCNTYLLKTNAGEFFWVYYQIFNEKLIDSIKKCDSIKFVGEKWPAVDTDTLTTKINIEKTGVKYRIFFNEFVLLKRKNQ